MISSPGQALASGASLKLLLENHYTLAIAGFASLGGLCFGYDQGVISNVLVNRDFEARFALSPIEVGVLTSILELFALFGSLSSSYLSAPLSPHRTLMIFAVVFLVGSAVQTAATAAWVLSVGRAVGGFGIGGLSTLTPLYMSEISPPETRGVILCLEQASIVLGVVVGYWTSWATRTLNGSISWRLPLFLQMLPAAILLVALAVFFPFSPRWLAGQTSPERQAEGRRVLAQLRKMPVESEQVTDEWNEILLEARFAAELKADSRGDAVGAWAAVKADLREWAQLFAPGIRRRTLVGTGVTFFQQLSGINALLYYGPELLEHLGLTGDSAVLLGSGMINIIQLVATIPPLILIDSLGRRPLLIVGAAGMAASYLFISAIVWQYGDALASHPTAAWSSVGGIYLFTCFYGVSFGPIGWILPSEVFPASCRGKGVSLSTSSTWFFNFLVGLLTPALNAFSTLALYLFFFMWCTLALVFALFAVPETRGVSLEEMAAVFGDSTALVDEDRKARIEREIAAGSDGRAGEERRGLLVGRERGSSHSE